MGETPAIDEKSVEERVRALHAAGDHARAAQVALESYGRELLRFAGALLKSTDEAEEAFSAACEKMWAGLPGFRFECSFRTWAFLIVRRVCFEQLSSPRVRRQVPLSAAGPVSAIAEQVRTETRPFLRTDVKDRFRALRESLSPEEQALLTLRVDRGLPWSQIAVILYDLDDANAAERRKREALLRKKLERLKERLREQARASGLLDG